MDWNKTNTILITAFLIINIILFGFIYLQDDFLNNNELKEQEEFLEVVKSILAEKNISISASVPIETYVEPFLEINYEILVPDIIWIEKFIGSYDYDIHEEILFYENNDKSIEFIGSKKITYKDFSEDSFVGKISEEKLIDDFLLEKEIAIDLNEFNLVENYSSEGLTTYKYVKKYGDFNLENAYIIFVLSDSKVIEFTMQNPSEITQRAPVETIDTAEALLRLMTFDELENDTIIKIEPCYYTNEDESFDTVNYINVDLVWKTVFESGKTYYLTGENY